MGDEMAGKKVFEMTAMDFAEWLANNKLFLMILHAYLEKEKKRLMDEV